MTLGAAGGARLERDTATSPTMSDNLHVCMGHVAKAD